MLPDVFTGILRIVTSSRQVFHTQESWSQIPRRQGDGSETHKVSLESHTVIQDRDGHSVDSLGYMIYNIYIYTNSA